MIPEALIHEGPESPHVHGTMTEWFYGEWVLKQRECERLSFLLILQPFVFVAIFVTVMVVVG